ncbi:unnamed protein product [Colias eurytheme]|nr:unnamed protein product [Colias eurytheme]
MMRERSRTLTDRSQVTTDERRPASAGGAEGAGGGVGTKPRASPSNVPHVAAHYSAIEYESIVKSGL